MRKPMKFEMTHRFIEPIKDTFTEENAPEWLTRMDMRWFWEQHVLKLEIGDSLLIDFQVIKRIK